LCSLGGLSKLKKENSLPELIVLDGGKGTNYASERSNR
jgi:excinuclease UvrABC nuclease subunit